MQAVRHGRSVVAVCRVKEAHRAWPGDARVLAKRTWVLTMKLWRMAIVAMAVAAAIVPTPSAAVERFYSTGAYPVIQRATTALSNLLSFALFDVLIVAVIGAWVACAVRDLRRARRGSGGVASAAVRIGGRTVVWAAALYLTFLLVWGMNYRRTPLAAKLRVDSQAVTTDAARRLAEISVEQLNQLHQVAHAGGWPGPRDVDPALARALAGADQQLGGAGTVVAGRPKTTALDWYFRRTATDGMTDPVLSRNARVEHTAAVRAALRHGARMESPRWCRRRRRRQLPGVAGLRACDAARPGTAAGCFWYSEVAGALDAPIRAAVGARLGPGPRADCGYSRAPRPAGRSARNWPRPAAFSTIDI